nr:hypothetical protein [Tanacetum cinerariifolium]
FESQSDFFDGKEIDNGKNEESVKPKKTSQEEKVEEFGGSVDNFKDETKDTHLSTLIGDKHTETLHNEMNARKQHLAFFTAAQRIHLPRLGSTVTVISLMRHEEWNQITSFHHNYFNGIEYEILKYGHKISIEKSPSYKEVDVAPLGSLLQFESQSDFFDDKEIDNGKNEESVKPKETSQEEKVEEFGGSVDNFKDETEDTHLSTLIGDKHTETVPENMVEVNTIVDKSVIEITISSVTSKLEDISEMDFVTKIKNVGDLQEADVLNDKSEVTSPSYAQELPNKRLSASVTQFNPSHVFVLHQFPSTLDLTNGK